MRHDGCDKISLTDKHFKIIKISTDEMAKIRKELEKDDKKDHEYFENMKRKLKYEPYS